MTGNFLPFSLTLQRELLPDGFSVLQSARIKEVLSNEHPDRGVTDWLLDPLTFNAELYEPDTSLSRGQVLLHILWSDFARRLTRKLNRLFEHVTLPPRGAILSFFGGDALSVIVGYRRSGSAVSLDPISVSEHPHGVFELFRLMALAPPDRQNLIKSVAVAPDKLVYQRGVLVHVNRYSEEDVLGPTIDTVILAELLAERLDESEGPLAALEIGPGSGMLSALLATVDAVDRVVAVDISPAAVRCTLKNLLINDVSISAFSPQVSVRGERFVPAHISEVFDLIVCNPPYIPEPPQLHLDPSGYQTAVAGLELTGELLRSIDGLLAPSGILLLMLSSVSEIEVRNMFPAAWTAPSSGSHPSLRVPLDIDVLWRHPDWQAQLLEEGRIERDEDGTLWHHLRPMWLKRP